MKNAGILRVASLGSAMAGLFLLSGVVFAQDPGTVSIGDFDVGSLKSYSDDDLGRFVKLLDETPTIPAESVPRYAAGFFSLQRPEFPPFPANIYNVPCWNIGNGKYLLSDLDVSYDTPTQNRMQMLGLGPPGPGDDWTNGVGDGGGAITSGIVSWGTNDLYLEIKGLSPNQTNSYLVIHPPWNETNGVWDVFGTTNLAFAVGGLNLTNWAWVLRSGLWQTNVSVINFSISGQSYFRLGTMLDSDGDGLTDAYERLVSHTSPTNTDTDGDGISDYLEVLLGLNPTVSDIAQPSSRLNYNYDAGGRLHQITGVKVGTIDLDNEGNVLSVSQ